MGNISKAIFRPILLSLLILFSSCSTRNLIQLQFDVPLTKTLNIAKSAPTLQICAELLTEKNATNAESSAEVNLLFSSITPYTDFIKFTPVPTPRRASVHTHSSVPIYILFSRLKIFG